MTQSTSNELADKRRRGLTLIAFAVGTAALVWGGWHWFSGRHHLDTDNAYVVGNVLQITPQVSGTVLSIQADETDFVRAGQMLVKLDEVDARMALEQAQAQLAQAVREVRSLFAGSASLAAQLNFRQADYRRAQVDLNRAQDDVNRRAPLVSSGAVSQEEFQHVSAQLASAQSMAAAAQSAVLAAKEQLNAGQTQTEGTTVDTHPNVVRAAAKLREAYLALQRVNLRAPIDGHVAKRSVQLGQRVAAGDEGQRTLQFFADRVEGNLLAAHQEIQKLALLYPTVNPRQPTVLSFDQVENAVLNVARYDVFKLSEAVLAGQAQRVQRMLDGLQAEGEAEVLVHYTLAEDIRALKRVKDAMAQGMAGDTSKDVSILNVALGLEHEAINAYQLGAGSGLLQKPVLDVAVRFQADHKAHRDALIATIQKLGGTPVMEK